MSFLNRRRESGVSTETSGVDAAWKIHQAQLDWTGRADAKAVFAFTIESAAATVALTLVTQGKVLTSDLPCWQLSLFWVALLLLLSGATFAALVVIPRLREKSMVSEYQENFIYFGHARLWNEEDLASSLKHKPILEQLSRQIVNTAKIAWQKHKRVQWSLTLGVSGAALMFLFACTLAVKF